MEAKMRKEGSNKVTVKDRSYSKGSSSGKTSPLQVPFLLFSLKNDFLQFATWHFYLSQSIHKTDSEAVLEDVGRNMDRDKVQFNFNFIVAFGN
jgi:hypothetical protein